MQRSSTGSNGNIKVANQIQGFAETPKIQILVFWCLEFGLHVGAELVGGAVRVWKRPSSGTKALEEAFHRKAVEPLGLLGIAYNKA